jgi:DMSO/TMAO reductase YedYZ molybdopterin-dependent catalytic subunit
MKVYRYGCAIAFVAVVVMACDVLAQAPQTSALQSITISGDLAKPISFTVAELKAMPRAPMKVTDEKGRTAAYDGVLLAEVLSRAGAAVGSTLKGKALSSYVVVTARDAYQVVFSLAELDPSMGDSNVLLADTMDNAPIPAAQGPLRIIVPHDKQSSRWVRQVEKIEVVQLRK